MWVSCGTPRGHQKNNDLLNLNDLWTTSPIFDFRTSLDEVHQDLKLWNHDFQIKFSFCDKFYRIPLFYAQKILWGQKYVPSTFCITSKRCNFQKETENVKMDGWILFIKRKCRAFLWFFFRHEAVFLVFSFRPM